MGNKVVLSNLVEKKALKDIQLEVLEQISNVISKTAGPYGSYTMIMHDNALTEYSKDGHKVLSNFRYFKPLERSIHDELLGITEHVIKKVGDGTTSAVQLSYFIYKQLYAYEDRMKRAGIPGYKLIETFHTVVDHLIDRIKTNGREMTVEDVKEICLISTNGNEYVSEDIANIYKEFGLDVFIQINTSNTESSIIKSYDGIILNKGMSSPSFINAKDNKCEIYNPHIYYFADPVDTPEMIQMFMAIFTENIYMPYQQNQPENYIPTVILAPSLSQDIASSLNDIEKIFFAFDQTNNTGNKPPFCIITGINDRVDNIGDIITLCKCPMIKKYINPDQRLKDIENGLAPSAETVKDFYGSADLMSIDIEKAKIINPIDMFDHDAPYNDDGSKPFSNTYNSLINFLTSQIEIESRDKNDLNLLASLKRRLHSLSANFVEYYIGGVSAADRDSVRDLVEDAVLNCRSAAQYGVGQGANVEGLIASCKLYDRCMSNSKCSTLVTDIAGIIMESYNEIVSNLYATGVDGDTLNELLEETIKREKAYNLREHTFTGNQVLCSIETDIAILEAISRVITIMFSSNQALLADPMQNAYINTDN